MNPGQCAVKPEALHSILQAKVRPQAIDRYMSWNQSLEQDDIGIPRLHDDDHDRVLDTLFALKSLKRLMTLDSPLAASSRKSN